MSTKYNFEMISPELKEIGGNGDYNKRYEFGPLENGFGITIGNALRRVALSSLPGGAVKQIAIKGVSSEFDVLPTIEEDIVSVILACKKLNLNIEEQDEEYTLVLQGNKKEF